MQPPLTNGTLLQNRFRIVKILGQGGCGRTYLAADEQRFQEKCAIKEYFPLQGNASAAKKSRELFQREAETLYQIKHPQIPEFRALFEEGNRFFFAQDFISGQPYNLLLENRLDRGQTFTETEVLELLKQLLPVLSYIHSRQIVHRDISPDNIMLRDSDRLPVLIDFGVVKLDTEQSEQPNFPYGTVVGKSGYSPIEQLKTGKVYPNSDLYALAVSAIVLLTGKYPENLFDEMNVSWIWQQYAPNTNPKLAAILDRMLSYRPQERYQSADEVLAELKLIDLPLLSNLVMVSRPAHPPVNRSTKTVNQNARTNRQIPNSRVKKSDRSKTGIWGIGIGLTAIIATISLISLVNSLKSDSVNKVPDRAASVNQPDQIDQPSTDSPELVSATVNASPMQISGTIESGQVRRYTIDGTPDRELRIQVLSGTAIVRILHPDGTIPPGNPTISTSGNYFFPFAGRFLLDVESTETTNFTLAISLVPRSGAQPQPGFPPPNRSQVQQPQPQMNQSPQN